MLTNSELNQKIADFQKKVQSEGYKDITFERYNMYSGNWGIRCMHKDYSDACYNTGTFGTMEQKYEKLILVSLVGSINYQNFGGFQIIRQALM